jgi:peptidyl-prolyl cis-trans isomerase D
MLDQLRRQTKVILWVVVVGFVGFMFFDWGMNRIRPGSQRAGLVGKVGKDRITSDEFHNEYRNQRAAYYDQYDVNPSMQVEQQIEENTWETLVQRHILFDEAAKLNLLPTSDEVLLEIQNNPPAFIRSQPIFQTDSVFDQSKYLAALSDPNLNLRPLEDYVRANLPYQKLRDYMASSVRVTDEEAKTFLQVIQEQAKISYLVVDPASNIIGSVPQPSDQEVSDYYTSHMETFRVPEKRILLYVEVPKEPSPEDRMYARTKIEDAEALVEAGEPFDDIAKNYSDDVSTSKNGGDLGWLTPGRLPAKLDSVLATLDVGQASGIIETPTAFYILRLDDQRGAPGAEEWKVSQIVASLQPSPVTLQNMREDLLELVDQAQHGNLEKAAADRGLETKVSPELARTNVGPFLGISPDDADRVFAGGEGAVTGPLEAPTKFYAVMVTEVVPSRVPAFEDIKDAVKRAYVRGVRRERALDLAEDALASVRDGKTLERAASDIGVSVHETQPFTRMADVPGVGKQNTVIAAAFALDQGEVSGVLEDSDRFYIVRVDEKIPLSEEDLGNNLANLRMSVISTKQQAFLASWYEDLRNRVKIEDYRTLSTY